MVDVWPTTLASLSHWASTSVCSVREATRRVDNEVDGLAFHVKFYIFTDLINYSYTGDAIRELSSPWSD